MKNWMLITAMIIGTAGMSFAQSSNNTSVNLTANVIQGLTISVSGSLGFGNIVAGTTPAALSAQSNSNAPLFTIAGDGGSQITVTFSTTTLTGTGNAITFTPSVYGAGSNSNQGTSTSVTSGGTVNLSGNTGSTGNYYFWLGGSLSALPANQTPGSYSGTWTLTVSY